MPPLTHRSLRHALAGPAITVILSFLAAVQALRLWAWRPGVPFSLEGDSPHVLMQVRLLLQSGWFSSYAHMGAPFGYNPSWFTTADALNFAGIMALGLLGGSPATVAGVFFILQFPLAALSAYWLSRQLHISRPLAVTVGVLFSVLPGHQLWFAHLWLSAYWMVPLALWLVLMVARGERLFPAVTRSRIDGRVPRATKLHTARTVAILAAVGLADVYYVAFTLILLGTVLVVRIGTGSRPRQLLQGTAAAGVLATLCGASLVVAMRGRVGDTITGTLPAQRVIGESEKYSGKLVELVLPWYEHRAAPLKFLSWSYGVAAAPPSVERPALGVVALVGVVGLLWYVVSRLFTGRGVKGWMASLAALLLVSLAFYTKGGLGSLVALFVSPQIRTWSRFVVFIELIGLLALGAWLTSRAALRNRHVAWPVAVALLVLGVLDQTNPAVAPDYPTLSAQRTELTSFGRDIQKTVGSCPVFQLPVVAFPEEPPPGQMGDYDHLLPSVLSPTGVTWSYGAIRGTSRADWQLALPVDRPRLLLDDLRAAGFCAVEVDHDGYAAGSDPGAALQAVLGAPVARAEIANLTAYNLGALPAPLRPVHKEAVLHPLVASLSGSLINVDGDVPFQWTGPTATITVANLGTGTRPATVSFGLRGNGIAPRSVTVSVAGAAERAFTIKPGGQELVAVDLQVPPGSLPVEVKTTGDAPVVAGTGGTTFAALRLDNLRLSTTSEANAASLQQFTAASPRSMR